MKWETRLEVVKIFTVIYSAKMTCNNILLPSVHYYAFGELNGVVSREA